MSSNLFKASIVELIYIDHTENQRNKLVYKFVNDFLRNLSYNFKFTNSCFMKCFCEILFLFMCTYCDNFAFDVNEMIYLDPLIIEFYGKYIRCCNQSLVNFSYFNSHFTCSNIIFSDEKLIQKPIFSSFVAKKIDTSDSNIFSRFFIVDAEKHTEIYDDLLPDLVLNGIQNIKIDNKYYKPVAYIYFNTDKENYIFTEIGNRDLAKSIPNLNLDTRKTIKQCKNNSNENMIVILSLETFLYSF